MTLARFARFDNFARVNRTILSFALFLFCACSVRGEETTQNQNSDSSALAVPKFDEKIIDAHKQAYGMSCIPSSVEMVLKLLGRVPASYYRQQDAWKNKADGNFSNFDGKTVEGITFHKQFGLDRNDKFPLARLFATIDAELAAGRFVIISLASSGGWHMYLIYAKDADGDFLAVSKVGEKTVKTDHVKQIVTKMKGTDILTYEVTR